MTVSARESDDTSQEPAYSDSDHYTVTVTGLGADTARVSASGELDLAAADRLAAVLDEQCVPGSLVQLDLSAVTFMDGSCLRVLDDAHRRCQATRGRLVLTGIGPRIGRLLNLTGLDRTLLTTTPPKLLLGPVHLGWGSQRPVRPEEEGSRTREPTAAALDLLPPPRLSHAGAPSADERALLHAIGEVAVVGMDSDLDLLTAAQAIIDLAGQVLSCDHAGLAVLGAHGRLETYASTGPTDGKGDLWQYDLGQGPCVSASTEGKVFVSNDIASDQRWPDWGPKAATLGLGSVLAVPLSLGDRDLGALSLYAASPQAYTPMERDRAVLFCAHATAALTWVREREHLRTAIDSRTQIGQAQGILMARFGLDAPQAFAVLRRYSQDANRKLRDVARGVVESGDLPTEHQGPAPPGPTRRSASPSR